LVYVNEIYLIFIGWIATNRLRCFNGMGAILRGIRKDVVCMLEKNDGGKRPAAELALPVRNV